MKGLHNTTSWRKIKHDFLHHFHKPRLDLLVWILVKKLAPTYYRKLDQLLHNTGRFRELPSWRKAFKREWKKLARTPIEMPINPKYRPDSMKWVCTSSQADFFFVNILSSLWVQCQEPSTSRLDATGQLLSGYTQSCSQKDVTALLKDPVMA